VAQTEISSPKVKFGIFEADLRSRELLRSGVPVRLQDQPFRVLMLLLESRGEIVTREELQHSVWGKDTDVDRDHGLKTAINKVREALKDSADNPRFIETLPRRGYRFIAPVTSVEIEESGPREIFPGSPALRNDIEADPPLPSEKVTPPNMGRAQFHAKVVLAAALGAISCLAVWMVWRIAQADAGNRFRISQVTSSGRVAPGATYMENLPAAATDGARMFFAQIENGVSTLSQATIADGDTSVLPVPSDVAAPNIGSISEDGSKLLVINHLAAEAEQALWVVPTHGGAAQRIPNILAHDATWMPGSGLILYAAGRSLYTAQENGTDRQQFATLPGRAFWLRWSPDGKRLRFTILDSQIHTSSLWEIDAHGGPARQLLPGWSHPADECCGSWTSDGKYFVFQSSRGGSSNIWSLHEGSWGWRKPRPVQLTNGPMSFQAPITGPVGHRVYFLGVDQHYVQLRYDTQERRFQPSPVLMNSIGRTEFSRDGAWVSWIRNSDGSLWCGRPDGTHRIQITSPPTKVWMMHWSPNSERLVYMGREPGKPWRLYVSGPMGSTSDLLLKEERNEADPYWSADGNSIVFGRLPDLMADDSEVKDIELVDVKSRRATPLPDSKGMFAPRWSPDGRYIAAMPMNQSRLMLFDTVHKSWRTLLQRGLANPTWSSDSQSIFFQAFMEEGQPIYRVALEDGHVERVVGLNDMQNMDIVDYSFSSLAPHDIPLIRARTWTANLYSLDIAK
jgi:Tol biopolymer transport system component/DNA-binding winged helix-turn-helix (wHTH) protein